MQEKGPADACWTSQDKDGNTVLHLAAAVLSAVCVEWILNQDFGTRLLRTRNHHGETPLELLKLRLEKLRAPESNNVFLSSVFEKFKGYGENAVHCLILLKRLGNPESGAPTANSRRMHMWTMSRRISES